MRLRTREVLMPFLDQVSGTPDLEAHYERITQTFLVDRDERSHFDWRYYFVKYDSMRTGHSGRYVSEDAEPGYRMVMLHKVQMNSNYRDPYLYQIWHSWRALTPPSERGVVENPWFTGYENRPRWLTLINSGIGIRCVTEGLELRAPDDISRRATFDSACRQLAGFEADMDRLLVRVPQDETSDGPVDTSDRIKIGVDLIKHFIGLDL